MEAIRDAIARLVEEREVDETLAAEVAREILSGGATPGQMGAFLTALRIRGEQTHHLIAFARVMREHARPVEIADADALVDTCGTGGDASGTFNISTAAALIAAGAGARVAKHGNRAISGKCGSADVLEALGVKIALPAAGAVRCLEEAGMAFFFAPAFHSAMRHVGPTRREMGVRTIFNMLGPMANPAGARRQLIGVYDGRLTQIFARVLASLGSQRVMIVHGADGLDEITTTGPTDITELRDGETRDYRIGPDDLKQLGIKTARAEELLGGTAEENAATIRAILAGEPGPKADIALLNAAAALVVADRAADLKEGIAQAREAVASGRATEALDKLIAASEKAEAEAEPESAANTAAK